MSYQVLARKWRPKSFAELVGQQQTAKALINALESQRLHHAYLFTGTRGVGKTTIARILSKSLNCEKGISSTPCGVCSSCVEIDQGNFVDLMEIDAASRTKVEDTRELLDNVQYRPTRGRYKVYLIDEVHMLSGHSFNALLKTLEEPPPHVIFLLATTDPQKLPVTVLSRCLQFHLKHMERQQIIDHLKQILTAEQIDFDPEALLPIAKGADGSMRDALSLLDQAIAFCGTKLEVELILEMLGSIDQSYCFQLLEKIQQNDAVGLIDVIQQMSQYSPDYFEVISDWLGLLHSIAVTQATQETKDQQLTQLAQTISPAELQLYYQLSLQAKKDLPFAPDAKQGFEMAMLRVLAFKPRNPLNDNNRSNHSHSNDNNDSNNDDGNRSNVSHQKKNKKEQNNKKNDAPIVAKKKIVQSTNKAKNTTDKPLSDKSKIEPITLSQCHFDNWHLVIGQLPVKGSGLQILMNSLACFKNNQLEINYLSSVGHLLTDNIKQSLLESIKTYFCSDQAAEFSIKLTAVEQLKETPKQKKIKSHQLAVENAFQLLSSDPCVIRLQQSLGAVIDRQTIRFE